MDTTAIKSEATPEQQTQRLAVRGCDRWIGWIDQTAQATARTRSSLLAAAIIAFAKVEGLPAPPPRI
jgi:hypothetical protein